MILNNPNYPQRKNIRLQSAAYEQNGIAFVTLCSARKALIFGFIKNGFLHPTPVGNSVLEAIENMKDSRPGITITDAVLMPNHLHILIQRERTARGKIITLGRFVGLLKETVSRQWGKGIWQRGYYDHLIRTPRDLAEVREYMASNPRKWTLDREYRAKEQEPPGGGNGGAWTSRRLGAG